MPQIADITVKKSDGTTNVVYTALVPAAGDASPARWRNSSVGAAPAHKPTFELAARDNGNKTGRRINGRLTYPSLVTASSGAITVVDKCIVDISAIIPNGMAQADIDEAVAQATNLFASALIVAAIKAGVSAT